MRHRVTRFRINRFTSWRKATVRSLVRSLLIYQSIKTTKVRARMAKQLADKLISLAKENSLAAKRKAFSILQDHALVSKLFGDIASRFPVKNGGYTRILGLGSRRGDNAELVILELTNLKKKEIKHPKKKKDAAQGQEEALQKPGGVAAPQEQKEQPQKPKTAAAVKEKEKPPITKKPSKNFLGGLRRIFKKERDSL